MTLQYKSSLWHSVKKICWFQDNTVVFLKCPQFHLSHPHVNKCSLDTLIWKYINEQACTSCIHLPLMGCIWWRLLHQPVKGCSSLMEMYPEFRGRYCTMQRDFLNFVFVFSYIHCTYFDFNNILGHQFSWI